MRPIPSLCELLGCCTVHGSVMLGEGGDECGEDEGDGWK